MIKQKMTTYLLTGRTKRLVFVINMTMIVMLLLFSLKLWGQDLLVVRAQTLMFSSTNAREKVAFDVVETLKREGVAHVVIALADPLFDLTQPDLNQLNVKVSAMQDIVLSSVVPSEFVVTHKYQSVPALAGNLLTEAGLNKLAENPYVSRIDLDVGGTGSLAISVPLIGADTWHGIGNVGDGIVVAVLDSGLDTDHSDLAPALIHQECFLDDDGSIDGYGLCPNGSDRQSGTGAAEDDAGHGTHVTGIIASRGNQSSVGVAPGVSVVAIKVTAGPSFSGTFYYFSEIVAALDYIINYRPDVQIINMSLVTSAQFDGDCDNTTSWNMAGASAINTLRSRGVVSFASSGNNGGNQMSSPACLSNVISVGATDNNDMVASFTDSNASTDIMAPGVGIVSSAMGNSTISASGTSMASPHAAGCAALLMASGEAVTPDQIETLLESSPIQVFNPNNGLTFPLIDCSFKPLSGVDINGPVAGLIGSSYSFVATSIPITATTPITYIWQSEGHLPITITNGLSNTVSFMWNMTGTKQITVSARNFGTVVTTSHLIHIEDLGFKAWLPVVMKNQR